MEEVLTSSLVLGFAISLSDSYWTNGSAQGLDIVEVWVYSNLGILKLGMVKLGILKGWVYSNLGMLIFGYTHGWVYSNLGALKG